jgi:sec-independent protein translocase protein TatA
VKPGLFQILIIALIVLVLFGRGRISEMMGDFGKGIKGFKRGLGDDETAGPQPLIEGAEAQPVVETADPRRAAD